MHDNITCDTIGVYTGFYENRILEIQKKLPDEGLRNGNHTSLSQQPVEFTSPTNTHHVKVKKFVCSILKGLVNKININLNSKENALFLHSLCSYTIILPSFL